ncbi:hypothetical protein METP2_02469 [Methanosarcinales archaeon]|nr:DUF4276 family protein [Candidatus Methanoperedens sp.]CAG0989188.1 hypothetical protein METP2_02469 [Methanosarcinales archaeon]
MNKTIYIEGGGDSKQLKILCRQGFRTLLEKCGFGGNMPKLISCGGRQSAFDDFQTAYANKSNSDYVAMLIDSEDPLKDLDETWNHLKIRDKWEKPTGSENEQVLFMTTCMETWIVADRDVLIKHYGSKLQESALPPLFNLESRDHQEIIESLCHATRNCSNTYKKGKESFYVLEKLSPKELESNLPSFARVKRILEDKLLR